MAKNRKKNVSRAKKAVSAQKDADFSVSMKRDAGYAPGYPADVIMEQLIMESGCFASDKCKLPSKEDLDYSVSYLADHLPAVQFVSQFYLELIVHGGFVAKDNFNQRKLNDWLEKRNELQQTNANVIREALLSSIIYGYSGLRKVFDNLFFVHPRNFRIWKAPMFKGNEAVPGIYKPILYEISSKDYWDVGNTDSEKRNVPLSVILEQMNLKEGPDGSYYPDSGTDGAVNATNIFLPVENFVHLRHSDDGDYGVSPLSTDRLRTTLIIDYIRNLIDEVNNDGTDYNVYLRQRNIAGASISGAFSTEATQNILNASTSTQQSRIVSEKETDLATKLALKMKRTSKTRINVIDKNHVEAVERMEGTVKLSEYITILNDAKGVVADIYGIPALLAGSSGGGWSTGMSALIPFTLERTIKPFQQRYAEQLSPIIRECAGVNGEIHFKELNWDDEKSREEIKKLAAQTVNLLEQANKSMVEAMVAAKDADIDPELHKAADEKVI